MVEHSQKGCTVRVSSQFQVELAIMKENSKCFVLVYSSLLLQKNVSFHLNKNNGWVKHFVKDNLSKNI